MTHTYSMDHVIATTESVNVEVAEKSAMTRIATDIDQKTGAVTSTYRLASGDAAYPATVSYRVEDQLRSGAKIRRISVTLNTWAADENSVDGTTTRKPLSGTVSLNVPADITTELADADDLIGNLFSYLYLSVAAGVRSTAWLQKLLFGVPEVV